MCQGRRRRNYRRACGGRVTILENTTPRGNHWLGVRARGSRSNRSAIGAVVTVTTPSRTLRRRIRSGSSYASQSELTARFGLGRETSVRRLSVAWPGGKEEVFPVDRVDIVMNIVEGRGS